MPSGAEMIRDRIKEFRRVPASRIRPSPWNWRLHPARQREGLNTLLKTLGFAGALLTRELPDGSLELIDGELRTELMGTQPVPTLVTDLSEDEAKTLITAFDPIGSMGETSRERLRAVMEQQQRDDDRMAQLLDDVAEEAGLHVQSRKRSQDVSPKTEQGEALREQWGVEPGQVWAAGRHRLMCGDSKLTHDVLRLLDGARPEAIITDPPYQLEAALVRRILHHFARRAVVLTGGKQAFGLPGDGWEFHMDLVWLHETRRAASLHTQPAPTHGNIVVLAHADLAAPDDPPPHDHDYALVLGHEGVTVGWRRPEPKYKSVLEVDAPDYAPTAGMGHAKSAALFVEMLRGFRWRVWCDPFLGTGATLIALEQLDKRGYGMEVDPLIFATALERLNHAGGLSPTLVWPPRVHAPGGLPDQAPDVTSDPETPEPVTVAAEGSRSSRRPAAGAAT